jgi:hypothetical protein
MKHALRSRWSAAFLLVGVPTIGGVWKWHLLLLGGPFASAVFAKGIVSYRTRQDPDSKSATSAAAGTANAISLT